MTLSRCSSTAAEICTVDARRARVRTSATLGGLDYVEVYEDGVTLCVHFFGSVPKALSARNVRIEGGARIRDIAVVDAKFHEHDDGDLCLLVTVNKTGDFSRYCVCLVEPGQNGEDSASGATGGRMQVPLGIDPRYSCAPFSFRLDCPSTVDCRPQPCPPPARGPLPAIDYLARDYGSFRRLLLDRLAQSVPQWNERHEADLGVTLVDLFAYTADQLSYQLDAVATEAYLRTARRRISVRRHARLVDYWMHEGINARAWVTIASNTDVTLQLSELAFASLAGDDIGRGGGLIDWNELSRAPAAVIFEPISIDGDRIDIVAAHSEIHFYTWQQTNCCLPAGSTRATLRDEPPALPTQAPTESGGYAGKAVSSSVQRDATDQPYRMRLKNGDVLILEETRGCATGSGAEADPTKRHVVRLTRATPGIDPLTQTRIWEIEWHRDDTLPFDLRLSLTTPAPQCQVKESAIVRGNVLLVDHGVTVDDPSAWTVSIDETDYRCVCVDTTEQVRGESSTPAMIEMRQVPARLEIELSSGPLTYADPVQRTAGSASALMQRDPRAALPLVVLDSTPPATSNANSKPFLQPHYQWTAVRDLLECEPQDRQFVVEIDDERRAHLRFGDGINGRVPEAGWQFHARCRVGNGPAGNVGREAVRWIAPKSGPLSGIELAPRNPLPAAGGEAPESVDDVKRYAPHAYGRVLERAVAAGDYAQLAQDDPRVQSAYAEMTWTGSWYEASIALDPLAVDPEDEVATSVLARLERARRIGHDLRLVPTRRVPLDVALSICVAPHYLRGDVEREVRAVLSNRVLANGSRGFFHPDELRFGTNVAGSRIMTVVQALEGVLHVELTRFARLYARASEAARSLDENMIAIAADEIAQLDGDPNFPEHGRISLDIKGGR